MGSLRYFPLTTDRFEHQIGVRALQEGESIVERTASFDTEVHLKRQLLSADRDNYSQAIEGSQAAEREAASMLIGTSCLLIEAAVQIQEDVVILRGDSASGHPITAGVVCFPSGWSIADKIGLPIDSVHGPVPQYAEVISRATNQLLARLKPNRPVWRMNWGVRPSGRLDQSPKQMHHVLAAARRLDLQNIGRESYFRVERQTLYRLPICNDILFTIHTQQCRLSELEPQQRSNLLGVLRTCPVETLRYKGIEPFVKLLCDDLSRR